MTTKSLCLLLLGLTLVKPSLPIHKSICYTVDSKHSIGENTRFWRAIGHDFLFQLVNEPVGQALLDRMAAEQSCVYFRTHYTFSNAHKYDKLAGGPVCGRVLTLDDKGNRHYDFSVVNKTFWEYVRRGMKPIIEFDFFPEGMAISWGDGENDEQFDGREGEPKDWAAWEDLLHRFMQNLITVFGKDEMRTWYFEVWNEPDSWNREHLDVFFRLYDVFASVVKSYDPAFKVGGPACYHIYFLRDFLSHIASGHNYVTGGVGAPLDFISYHLYGLSGSWLTAEPSITPMVQRFTVEILWIQRLLEELKIKNVEFHLNEWGQCSHFYRRSSEFPDLIYRDDERAALFMIKLVDHLYAIGDHHGFKTDLLGYWGFCWEAKSEEAFIGRRELTTSGNVPKPILTAYEMLARLGEKRLCVLGPKVGGPTGLLATKTDNGVMQLLLYNYDESDQGGPDADSIHIVIKNLDCKTNELSEYLLDRDHHNTYRLWQKLGSPKKLSAEIRETLQEASRLKVDHNVFFTTNDGIGSLAFAIPRRSMRLIIITPISN